jgi:hypothetical protein
MQMQLVLALLALALHARATEIGERCTTDDFVANASPSWDAPQSLHTVQPAATSLYSLRSALGVALRDAILNAAHGRLARFRCSPVDVQSVLDAGDNAAQVVANMMPTRSECAICILPCSSVDCIRACRQMHGEHLHHNASTALLARTAADARKCMQCFPEHVESVCGEGCVTRYTRQTCRPCTPVETASYYAAQIFGHALAGAD